MNNLPPHERRRHWLSATMSSFNRTLLWRAFRDRQWLVRSQLRTLDIETTKVTRIASPNGGDDFWTFPRLAAWLRDFAALHAFVIAQYQQLMDGLTRTKRGWRARSRQFREATVKHAVVLHAYTTMLADIYLDVFVVREDGELEPWLKLQCFSGPFRARHVRHLRRRWSEGDGGDLDARMLRNRWELERRLSCVATCLERRVLEDMVNVRALYDSGELFREFCLWVAWTNEERTKLLEMWGGRYKYPRQMWAIKLSEKPEWQPMDGVVLSWEEDKVLQSLFC